MKHLYLYFSTISLLFFTYFAFAQVEELSNTEMTEAYILDDSIIVKQTQTKPQPRIKTETKIIKLGPGEPVVSDTQASRDLDNQANQQSLYDQEILQRQGSDQLQAFERQAGSTTFTAETLNSAAQAQQANAHALVRNGLNLPSDTEITPAIMAQYLASFSGQTTGDPLQAQQTMTNAGFQFIIPNPGGNIQTGLYSSGDGSMNVESNNSQLIFNLLFPQTP